MSDARRHRWLDWITDRVLRGLVWLALRLPYERRVALTGALMRRVIGPAGGWRARALGNLAHIYPDMPEAERQQIANAVLDNVGRTIIENYSSADMLARAPNWTPEGPGWEAVDAAHAAGRPILFVSAHYGNYQAARAALNLRGYDIGGLFRPMSNPFVNDHYIATLEGLGGGAFPRDRRGLAGFVKKLKSGGQGAILIDQFVMDGMPLDFLGQPALTSLSAAEMALKYDALLVPVYSERLQNGVDFRLLFEDPVPHSDAVTMTQALNDSLAAQIRRAPKQWFWVHRRWKPEDQRHLLAYAEVEAAVRVWDSAVKDAGGYAEAVKLLDPGAPIDPALAADIGDRVRTAYAEVEAAVARWRESVDAIEMADAGNGAAAGRDPSGPQGSGDAPTR